MQVSKAAAKSRRRRATKPGYSTAKNAKWQAAHPEKRHAHKIVEWAIRRGDIERQRCERCGCSPAHAHHDDYSKPLEITWLCAVHHRERHSELKSASDLREAA